MGNRLMPFSEVETTMNFVLVGLKSTKLHDEANVELWELSRYVLLIGNCYNKNWALTSDQEMHKLCNDFIITIVTTDHITRQLSDLQDVIWIYVILETTWRGILGNISSNLGLAFNVNRELVVLLMVCEITKFSDINECLLTDFSKCAHPLLLHLVF